MCLKYPFSRTWRQRLMIYVQLSPNTVCEKMDVTPEISPQTLRPDRLDLSLWRILGNVGTNKSTKRRVDLPR